MRYATVVVRRTLTRLSDDWHRRGPGGSAGTAWVRLLRLGAGPLLNALVRQVLALAVLSVRFLTVASPATAAAEPSAPVGQGAPSAPDTDREPLTAAQTRARARARAQTLVEADPVATPAAVVAGDVPARSALARLQAFARTEPRMPGAHPVTLAAIRRDASRTATPGFLRRATSSLVVWLRPILDLLVVPRTATPIDAVRTGATLSWPTQHRLVGGAVAVLVLVASVIGVSPVHNPVGGTGNVLGAGIGPRIAIGGGSSSSGASGFGGGDGTDGSDGGFGGLTDPADQTPGVPEFLGFSAAAQDPTTNQTDDAGNPFLGGSLDEGISLTDPTVATQDVEAFAASPETVPDGITPGPDPAPELITDVTNQGAFLADGTILKPIAVDTSIPDARTLLTSYTVRKGDSLTSIAHHFGLSMVTLYWANHLTTNLKTKTDLKVGQKLSIPPVNGVLHVVTDKETLTDIAKRTGVSVNKIVSTNGLTQPTVFVGQWIIVPGAKAKPIPVPSPKPVVKPATRPSTSTTTASKPTPRPVTRPAIRPTYTGGGWVWPAPGGHISQYFHYGHWAIDIADTYGNPVLAAKGGVVVFAGWKNNGGGWQVWISHGNGVYTTYNHMSSLTVGSGQSVGAGHQVGRIGATGHATGPHLHFEVWIGPIWNGGTRVNPLNYV